MQDVSSVGVWLSKARCCSALPKISPTFFLIAAVSALSLSLSSSHTFTPYSDFTLPSVTFSNQSKGYDDYEIMTFIMANSVFRIHGFLLTCS
jgi:hypothetical protein